MSNPAMARKASAAESEEFLQSLYKGGELLAAGKVIEAKDFLEKAYKLQPKNEKGQNLLGLAYFKLGLFDRAAEIYEGLVRENPADATLRVNLGLVYLKTNALPRAIREFETATDLAPEHKKAQNYLGLALAQAGEFARAKEHFLLSGSEAMAEKMDRALRGEEVVKHPEPKQPAQEQGFAEIEGHEVVAERGGQQVAAEEDRFYETAAEQPPVSEETWAAQQALQQQDWGSQFGGEEPPPPPPAEPVEEAYEAPPPPPPEPIEAVEERYEEPPPPVAEEDAFSEEAMSAPPPAMVPAEVVEMEVDAAPPPPPPEEVSYEEAPTFEPPPAAFVPPAAVNLSGNAGAAEVDGALELPIAELAPTLQLFPPPLSGPFVVRNELAAVVVKEQMLSRVEGLVSVVGKLTFQPETKRFRGRATDKPFGDGDRRMVRVSGEGMLIVDITERKFVSMELNDESGYFQEEQVFAFEEALAFENGRVPSDIPPDLDLVHLRGKGRVLLAMNGPMRSLQVSMETPVTVPMVNLVGWYGNLTPKVVPILTDAKGRATKAGVELSGEGFALISVPMR